MSKIKSAAFSIAIGTLAITASAQSFTPAKPFLSLSKFGDTKVGSTTICWENYKADFTCSPSDTKCKIALEELSKEAATCGMAYDATSRQYRKEMPIPLALNAFENAVPDATWPKQSMPQNFESYGQLEFFYQALMYVPALPSASMSASDIKKAAISLDGKLNKINTDRERVWNRVFDKGQTWGSWNKAKIQTTLKAQEDSIQKRRNVINFMSSSEDAFKQYKTAFNKFFTPQGAEVPILNASAVQGKSLTAYECQFLNATEDFQTIQAQYKFSCAK
ncbi:hypothetical protein SR914_21325 [Comamonas testosteroni]|uniref:Uncharacterized protein n=1 Tax=Comamonas testosteroni (strain DSM 14576 / KF-1) TaxID=399795 RepID=B7WUN0_COMTK|nr:hypothetical protein [Comamonas testosteroni]EED67543.1 hypothetical protein CtesDRAFT_PD2489 [Comamonas testosteroni KF-1]WQG65690.1 hypothetical protein SR914_21325 [Comamonas testosteroni]